MKTPLTAGISVSSTLGSGPRNMRSKPGTCRALSAVRVPGEPRPDRIQEARRVRDVPQGGADRLGDRGRALGRHADVKAVDRQRLGDLRARELGHAATGEPPREAGDEPAVGDRVVAGPLRAQAAWPRRQALFHREVVEHLDGVARARTAR